MVTRYNQMIFDPAVRKLYEGTDFFNVGDWSKSNNARSLPQACADLVKPHIEIISVPRSARPRRVLDVGCGLGACTELIARHFDTAEVLGVNLSYEQLQHARSYHPGANYCVMNATQLALVSESFDCVLSIEAAFHFSPRVEFLRSAHRVLMPGGRLVLSDILFRPVAWTGAWSVPEANFLLSVQAYEAMCRDLGFTVELVQDVTEFTWRGFCRYLRAYTGQREFADQLERAVLAYVMVCLQKPATVALSQAKPPLLNS
jgi:ubiquinone/menaquinone biosynthesis C-methylase UbiE